MPRTTDRHEDFEPFSMGRYHLGKEYGSSRFYIRWYDPKKNEGEVIRRSLFTKDRELAVRKIAHVALMDGQDDAGRALDPIAGVLVQRYLRAIPAQKRRNWGGAPNALLEAIEEIAPDVPVSRLFGRIQKGLMHYIHEDGWNASSTSNCLRLLSAAITWGNTPDDDGYVACVHKPAIITNANVIAEILDVPDPEARTYHPDREGMAKFIAQVKDDEPIRRYVLLALAFACRPTCAREAHSDQLDVRHKLYKLNPPGRRQTKKYRPKLPVTPSVLNEMLSWGQGPYVNLEYAVLRSRISAHREACGFGDEFIPYCIRHFMATALRSAYEWYEADALHPVPEEQRDFYLGHRRPSTGDLYGEFDPGYLLYARRAVEAILLDLNQKSGGALFRQVSAKSPA